MAYDSQKFGIPARKQIGNAIKTYASTHFDTAAAAAKDLKISRQRLHSYTSGKSLPGAVFIDMVNARWNLNLLGSASTSKKASGQAQHSQLDLFHSPMILRNDQVEVVVKRKGVGLIAEIKISASVKIA